MNQQQQQEFLRRQHQQQQQLFRLQQQQQQQQQQQGLHQSMNNAALTAQQYASLTPQQQAMMQQQMRIQMEQRRQLQMRHMLQQQQQQQTAIQQQSSQSQSPLMLAQQNPALANALLQQQQQQQVQAAMMQAARNQSNSQLSMLSQYGGMNMNINPQMLAMQQRILQQQILMAQQNARLSGGQEQDLNQNQLPMSITASNQGSPGPSQDDVHAASPPFAGSPLSHVERSGASSPTDAPASSPALKKMGIEASTKSLKLNPNMNREAFLRAYHSFCTQTKAITLPPTMPIFAGKPLDVYSLFFSVMQLGGFAQVQENRLWKYVLVMMGLPANITSAGNALKKHYASLLEPFEPEFNGRQKEWLQAGLVSRIYSFRTSNVAAEDSMASSAQMSPASRPDMDDRDEVGVSSTNIATPQPGPIAESSSTSLDFADGPELASAGSMSAEEAKEKKNDKKQRVYQPVTRTLDTDGGILVDYIKKLYRGSGEANSARLKLTKNDLGTVDLFRLTMQLSSRLTVDVYDAIRTLLILTYDSSVDLRIAQYPDLVRELFLLWKEALNVLMKPNSDGQHCNSKFWSYEELFELEEGLLINPLDSISIQFEHAIPNQDVLLPRTALALPSTNKSLRPFLSNSFAAAELAVAIGTIFRNLSQPNENAKYLAQWHAFCEVLILWSRFQPSNHRDLTTTINAMKPKSFKRKYSVHDRDNQVRVPNGKRQKVVDGKIHALSHDKSSKAQLLDNSLVSLDVDNIIDNLDVSDRHGTFLQHRKITFSILHNLSLYFMLNNVNDAEWVLRVLLNFMTSGDSMCQDPDVIGGSLPCNAVIQSEYSTYSWAGLDILMRLLVNVENRRLFSSIPLALLESLVTALLAEVPTGSSFRVQGNQDRGTDLSVRWYDMLSVETSLHCLCFLAESSSIVRQTIARRPHAMVLFTRLTTGMSWSNVPVYLRDPAFSQTQVYATGIRSLTETRSAFEREKMQEMSLGMAKLGGKIFLQLVKDPISRAALSEKRRSNPPMPGFQWGYHDRPNRGLQVDSTSTSIDEVLAIQGFCETNWKNDALSGLPVSCTDVEMTLLGMTINPRLPRDHAELVTSILYYLARDSKEEDRALDIQSGDMDASQGNEGQTVIT